MQTAHPASHDRSALATLALLLALGVLGCSTPAQPPDAAPQARAIEPTHADRASATPNWPAVQRAVARHAPAHRDAFYASRAHWHAGDARGDAWTLDHAGDLTEPLYIDGRARVFIAGNANADIEINRDAVVHILGDLDATLELIGVCEVIVAGDLTANATVICDGTLDLYVQGHSDAILGATGSATIIINGNAQGVIQCGAPATSITVQGDLAADIPAPRNRDTILSLRVAGFAPAAMMLDLAAAGFTRVNATLGTSDTPPGFYPQPPASGPPTTRWVVLGRSAQTD